MNRNSVVLSRSSSSSAPQEELRHPAAAQVALVTHALAAAAVLRAEGGIDAASAQGALVDSVLGHSVGEISACAK